MKRMKTNSHTYFQQEAINKTSQYKEDVIISLIQEEFILSGMVQYVRNGCRLNRVIRVVHGLFLPDN